MEELNPTVQTKLLPIMFLRGKVLLPNNIATIDVARAKSLAVIDYAIKNGRYVFFTNQKDKSLEQPTFNDVYSIGVIGFVKEVIALAGNNKRVVIQVFSRAKLMSLKDGLVPFAEVTDLDFTGEEKIECAVYKKLCLEEYAKLTSHQKKKPEVDFFT